MTKIIDGKTIAQKTAEDLAVRVSKLKSRGVAPKLVNIGINPDKRAEVYIRLKDRIATQIGITYEYLDLSDKSQEECLQHVAELAQDNTIHGIIVQLPMRDWYDPQVLLNMIPLNKDVDGLSDQSLLALKSNTTQLIPATPLAILELLKQSGVDLQEKTVTIVGQGKLVGLPLGIILQNLGVRVLTADIHTSNLAELTQQADIVVSATGKAGLITADSISEGCIVIDAGIIEVNGQLRGDVDFESVNGKAGMLSPVPGGVGPMTVAMLLSNVVNAASK